MKTQNFIIALLLSAAVISCSDKSADDFSVSLQPPGPQPVSDGVDIQAVPLPGTDHTLVFAGKGVPGDIIKPVADADKRQQLSEQTEKVYLRWNAAVASFRQTQNRWPHSLRELQQNQPDLAEALPPDGFRLLLDAEAGEVYLARAGEMGHGR